MGTSHQEIIQLVIAYTLTGAFVFTVGITCLSLVGIVKFVNPKQQNKLFAILIVEIVVMGLGSYSNFLKFDPKKVAAQIETRGIIHAQEKVYDLLDKIDKLPDKRVIKLANNPPVDDAEVDQIITSVDPDGLRLKDPDIAKRILKMRVVLGRRSPLDLNNWEKAISES
jgi:hypothetical protein